MLKAVDSVVKKIIDETGGIHILVNNAGITQDNLFMRMKPEQWSQVIDVNLNGVFHVTKAVIRTMVKQRSGRIINISSVVGFSGNPGQVNYSSTKSGLIGFTKSLSREVGTRGITVNAVAPGFINTAMTQALNESQQQVILAVKFLWVAWGRRRILPMLLLFWPPKRLRTLPELFFM